MNRKTFDFSHAPRRAAAAVALLAITPGLAAAGGFFVEDHSVKGAGRAFSGEVADRGADSVWWNPAAIARSGPEASVGVHHRWISSEANDTGSNITRPIPPAGLTLPVGGTANVDDPMQDITTPNGSIVVPLGDRLSVGLSATRPFHFESDYGAGSWARYNTIEASIQTTDLQATAAYQLTPWLDVGAGVSAQYTEAHLRSNYPNISPFDPDATSELNGDGWNYGWTVGAQMDVDRLTLGASYRSAVEQELDAAVRVAGLTGPLAVANVDTNGQATFTTPWIAVIGARFRATERLTANIQVSRFGWSEYDAVTVSFTGGGVTIPQRFQDTTTYAVGADYELSPMITLRGGIQFDETPTRNDLREAGVVDSDRVRVGVGASWAVSPNMTFDAALSHTRYDENEIFEDYVFYPGTGADTTARLRGSFEASSNTASVGLRWRF